MGGAGGTLELEGAEVIGRFKDKPPDVTRHRYGKGTAVHMAFLPGISYTATLSGGPGKFPVTGQSTSNAGDLILLPVRLAGVQRPVEVDRLFVKAPVLASDLGLAVTLPNWTNEPQQGVKLRIRTDRPVHTFESAMGAKLDVTQDRSFVDVALDLATVDVLMLGYTP